MPRKRLISLILAGAIAAIVGFDHPAQARRHRWSRLRRDPASRISYRPRRSFPRRPPAAVAANVPRVGYAQAIRDRPVRDRPVSDPVPPVTAARAPASQVVRVRPAWSQGAVSGEIVSQSGMVSAQQVMRLTTLGPQQANTMRTVVPQAPYKQSIDPTGKYFIDWYRVPANSTLRGQPAKTLLVGLRYDWQAGKYIDFGLSTNNP